MISLSLRAEPGQIISYLGRALSLFLPDTSLLLPIQTPSVTPGPSELHFYSGRHVRDRVRLHLRRVTENNNTENERDENQIVSGTIENDRMMRGTSRTTDGVDRSHLENGRKGTNV